MALAVPASSGNTFRRRLDWFVVNFGTIFGLALVAAFFAYRSPSFRTFNNFMNIILQSMPLLMVSLAMTTALILRAVDLSVAYVADLTALAAVSLLIAGYGAPLSIAGGLGVGAAIGVVNGLLIVSGVPALVATLGMMFIIKSLELLTTGGGQPLLLFVQPAAKVKAFLFLGQGKVGPIPMQVVLGILVLVVVYLIMYRSHVGRYFQAIGGNVKVAYLSGVPTKIYFSLGYVMSGVLAACAGLMNATRSGIAQPEGSSYLLLDSFVASYIGSITFCRGRMNIMGTVIGVLFVSVLTNGVNVLGLGVVYQYLAKGLLIFIAVALARAGMNKE